MNILEAREQRSNVVKECFKEYHKSIVTVKGNVVGQDKNPYFMGFVLKYFNNELGKIFKDLILFHSFTQSIDGNYYLVVIDEAGESIKEKTMELEESSLGRLIDIDVYEDKTYSRKDFSKGLRTCLVCDKAAFICARSKRHTEKEIVVSMKEIVKSFLSQYLLDITDQAIKKEVDLYPSFGLVSKIDSGCHKDMDCYTFIRSKNALKRGIKKYIDVSFQKEINEKELISIGLEMEKDMFEATNNINTHKGLIFLLGIFLPVLGQSIYYNEASDLDTKISSLSRLIVKDYYLLLANKKELSHSDTIYLNYNIKGIRNEGLNGLKKIFLNPLEDKDEPEHTRLMNDLLYFMSILDDTTIIHKKDIQTLKKVKEDAKEILSNGGYANNKNKVLKLSEEYKKNYISPGGSADMLVIMTIYRQLKYLVNNEDR